MATNEIVRRPGDKIKVRWGKLGEVDATISRVGLDGKLFAKRYRPKFRNYTKPRRVYPVTTDGILFDVMKPKAGEAEVLM